MPDVFSILDDLGRNVAALRESLSPLRNLAGRFGTVAAEDAGLPTTRRRKRGRRPAAGKPAARKATAAPRTKRRFSPRGRAALKLAGRYMGLVRNLTAAQKAKVKKVREKRGYGGAIKFAASMR
jgi:hypothetical protein